MIDLSTLTARKQLAGKYAAKYSLDPNLICALADHESSWNPWAIRYEPSFYSTYIQPLLNTGKIHDLTEATARAISWGLCQVMGEVAREYGYTGKLAALCDPDTGLDIGCQKLQRCMTEAGGAVREGLLKYNGGGDPNYPDLVLDCLAKYQEAENA